VNRVKRIYGVHSLQQWEARIRARTGAERWLGDTTEESGRPRQPYLVVHGYKDLVRAISFLAVMNKLHVLLFRGQTHDFPQLLPSLYRAHWRPAWASVPIPLDDREHYWNGLATAGKRALGVLQEEGLPRHRHVEERPAARWAVLQHYDLWPTPLLDFTTSLRVAASFAFGLDPAAQEGFLYVVAVRGLRSDLMPLREHDGDARRDGPTATPHDDPDRDDAQEREDAVMAIRLNAVCPPSTSRPHLQDGVLIGHYPFGRETLHDATAHDASSILVARLRLVNAGSFFTDDFPIHSRASLLPGDGGDALDRKLRDRFRYTADASGKVVLA